MGVSVSGVLTLLGLVFCGPLYYGLEAIYKYFYGANGIKTLEKKSSKASDSDLESYNDEPVMTMVEPAKTIHEDDRGTMHSYQYMLSLIGYAIGIGNVWRFPYIIAQNGGAAALLAYIISAAVVAVPLFMYEMIVGQHTRLSTIRCYNMIRPRWTSLGYAAGLMLFLVLAYYGMIIAYTLPYIWYSLQDPLPWLDQGAETFWFEEILNSYPDLNDDTGPGPIQFGLALSLIVFWVVVFLTAGFGKDFLSKVTIVTVILPVAFMTILIIRTIFLEGSLQGLQFYLGKFEYSQLTDFRVWSAACGQIIFSLSPGFGTAITYSSFAKPKEDVYRACLIVALTNSSFSIFSGIATFSLVGHLAFKAGIPVEQVASRSGTGLAFITMAEAMQYFGPFANMFSVMFFFTLFVLGLNTAYAWLETLVSYVNDFVDERGWLKRPVYVTSMYCICLLLVVGLAFTTRLGNESLDVIDHFVGTVFLLLVTFVESIMFILDFKWDRMEYALRRATYGNPNTPFGRSLVPSWMCRMDFFLTVPLITGFLALYLFVSDMQNIYGGYPFRLVSWGYMLLVTMICIIPLTLWKTDKSKLPSMNNDVKDVSPATALAYAHGTRGEDDNNGFNDSLNSFEKPSIMITSTPTTTSSSSDNNNNNNMEEIPTKPTNFSQNL